MDFCTKGEAYSWWGTGSVLSPWIEWVERGLGTDLVLGSKKKGLEKLDVAKRKEASSRLWFGG